MCAHKPISDTVNHNVAIDASSTKVQPIWMRIEEKSVDFDHIQSTHTQ
jgi:hypothetical protein